MNELAQQAMQYVSVGLIAIGVLACVVSIITQVIKNTGILKGVATNIVVVALSIILTIGCTIAYLQYIKQPIFWYYVFASFIASFIIALISMQGWRAVFEIWNRTKYDKNTTITTGTLKEERE